jgi:hypothetical protein
MGQNISDTATVFLGGKAAFHVPFYSQISILSSKKKLENTEKASLV